MKNYLFVTLLLLWIPGRIAAQDIREIDREDLLRLTGTSNDTTYVVNFWATWCSPCVKEVVYFEDLYRRYKDSGVRVVLVSLDFPNQLEKRLVPFIREKNITAPVRLMTDLQYNEWIDQVDPDWSGAIPATLIYNSDQRVFLEKELNRKELFAYVQQIHH
jgi:thiol-disulfide isomerase/thioredoxin